MKFRILISSITFLLIPFSLYAATISPATLDLQASRGETIASKFTVINTSAENQNYFLGTMAFQPRDETGAPQFLDTKTKENLTQWILFPLDHITVPANSKVDVPFQVVVPSDIAAASYESAITVASAPTDVVATNGAIIEAKTATLVFLTIKGESTKKAALLDFKSDSTSVIRSTLDRSFTYRIQNQGNVYFAPIGTVVLKDVFGRTLRSFEANVQNGRVLPSSTRTFPVASDKNPKGFLQTMQQQMQDFTVGPITSTLSLKLGDGFAPITSTTTFLYVPIQLVTTILIILCVVLLVYKKSQKRFSKKS